MAPGQALLETMVAEGVQHAIGIVGSAYCVPRESG